MTCALITTINGEDDRLRAEIKVLRIKQIDHVVEECNPRADHGIEWSFYTTTSNIEWLTEQYLKILFFSRFWYMYMDGCLMCVQLLQYIYLLALYTYFISLCHLFWSFA